MSLTRVYNAVQMRVVFSVFRLKKVYCRLLLLIGKIIPTLTSSLKHYLLDIALLDKYLFPIK